MLENMSNKIKLYKTTLYTCTYQICMKRISADDRWFFILTFIYGPYYSNTYEYLLYCRLSTKSVQYSAAQYNDCGHDDLHTMTRGHWAVQTVKRIHVLDWQHETVLSNNSDCFLRWLENKYHLTLTSLQQKLRM